jgi:hypothetical protein
MISTLHGVVNVVHRAEHPIGDSTQVPAMGV